MDWHLDSTGSRYLLWVWYRTAGQEDYRLLNLEIVQEGLSLAKAAGSFSYGEYITKAAYQASVLKIRLWDKDAVDENWYDGDAIPITIKELRTNIEEYVQKKVSIEGIITRISGSYAYIEDYDEETEEPFAFTLYMGFDTFEPIVVGNELRVIGTCTYYETGGTYQVSGLCYYAMRPNYKDNIVILSTGNEVEPTEISFATLQTRQQDLLSTFVSAKDLTVTSVYTTESTTTSDGAMTLTCKDSDENQIIVRTTVIKKEDGEILEEADVLDKNISVTGVVDLFSNNLQIRISRYSDITFNE